MGEKTSRLPTPSVYEAGLFAVLCLWVTLNCALALWLFSPVRPAWAALGPAAAFAVLFTWAYVAKAALLEIHASMDWRDKAGLFAVTLAFAFAPLLLDAHSDGILCLAALNLPLAAMACRHAHFQRLYCLNLAVTVLIVRRAPGFPVALLGFEALLICGCFAADYVAFRAEGYPEAGRAGLRLVFYSALGYVAAAAGALALCWAALPPLRPLRFELWPRVSAMWLSQPVPAVEGPIDPRHLFYYYAALLAALAVAYTLLRWALARLARRKTASIQLGEDERVKVSKTARAAPGRRPVFDLSTPRGRIVYAYNVFLQRLAGKGLAKPPGATPAEFAAQLQASSTLPNKAVSEATEVFESAHFGLGQFSQAQAEAYREKLERLSEDAQPYSDGAPAPALQRLPKRRLEAD